MLIIIDFRARVALQDSLNSTRVRHMNKSKYKRRRYHYAQLGMESNVSYDARMSLLLNPSKGETPTDRLCGAIECGDEKLFESLLRENSSMYRESLDSRGYSPLHVAILCKRHVMIERLLRERVGYGLRSKNYGKKGWTAYHFAAMCLDIDTLKMLKSSGFPFNPNERTELGSSPLHLVNGRNNLRDSKSQSQQKEVIKFLIELGCDPLLQNEYGNTVVHESILWNDNSGLELMLSERDSSSYFFKTLIIMNKGFLLPCHLMQTREVPFELRKTICVLLSKIQRSPMKDQLQQKRMGLTDSTYAALSLSSAIRTLPETISNPPHMLTREDICTIFAHTLPVEGLLNALIQAGHILKYSIRSKEVRYMYPQCLPDVLHCDPVAHPWPLGNMCGRFLTLHTGSITMTTVYKLMNRVVTKWENLRAFEPSQIGFYFETGGVQCAVRHTESRRHSVCRTGASISRASACGSYGVEVVVCSLDASIEHLSLSRQLLAFCVGAVQSIQRESTTEDIQIGVMSTLDLMRGNRTSAHIYSSAEVSHAQREGQQLLHPNFSTPEPFASLLLSSLSSPPRCEGGHVPEMSFRSLDEKGYGTANLQVEVDGVDPHVPQVPQADGVGLPVPLAKAGRLVPRLNLETFSEEVCRDAVTKCYGTLTSQLDPKLMTECLVERHHLNMMDAHKINKEPSPYDKMVALLSMLEERGLCKALLQALEHTAINRKEHLSPLSLIHQTLQASQSYSDSGVSSYHEFNCHNDDNDIVGKLSKASAGILLVDGCSGNILDGHQKLGGHIEGHKIWGHGTQGDIGGDPWRWGDHHGGRGRVPSTTRMVSPRAVLSDTQSTRNHTTTTLTDDAQTDEEEFLHIELPLAEGDRVLPHGAERDSFMGKIKRLLGLANGPAGGGR